MGNYSFSVGEMLFLSTSSFFDQDEITPVIVIDCYYDEDEEYIHVVNRVSGEVMKISSCSSMWKKLFRNQINFFEERRSLIKKTYTY